VILWDVTRRTPLGEPLARDKFADRSVESVAFSPDGKTLAPGQKGDPLGCRPPHAAWLAARAVLASER